MSQPNYRYPDSYVASFKHIRDLNTALRSDLLPKTGGVISAPIYETSQTDGNRLATRQYVTDAVTAGGGGGGGGGLPDEIKTSDGTTSVKTTIDAVEIKDDNVLIATVKKDATALKIKSELDGLVLATNDLTLKNKDESATIATFNTSQIQTTTSILQNALQGSQDGHLTRKDYVDQQIATAKQNITQLVDADQTDGAKYKLQINNNQLEYFRGAEADDLYLKQFGTSANDGVVFQTNKSRYFLESDNVVDTENQLFLRGVFSSDPAHFYNKAGQLSLRYGYLDETTPNAYATVTAAATEVGSASTRLLLYPKTVANNTDIVNQAMFNSRLGYESTTPLTQQNADSILKRSENDTRYYQTTQTLDQIQAAAGNVSLGNHRILNLADPTHPRDALPLEYADNRYYEQTQRLDEIVAPQLPLNLNSQKITSLAAGTQLTDAVNVNQLQNAKQAYSTVRKTTTALTNATKVTGFTISEEFNASQNCYFDNANQTFLVTTATNPDIRVKFTCVVKFGISATGNTATIVMRDFTNSTNYADTTMTLAQQNQTGTFERSFSVIKSFNTNRFVGLYVTAINGSPPFSTLDITFTAETVFVSTAINKLANSTNTQSISMGSVGLNLDQPNQEWFLNNATLYGVAAQDYNNTDFDALTRKDYVDGQVSGLLLQQDGYLFKPGAAANSFVIQKVSNSTQPFIIQTDLDSASTFTVQNDLRLAYSGVKTLTDDSLMRKADVVSLIQSGGSGFPNYYTFRINIGDVPSSVESFQSTSNIISNVSFTLYADTNIGSYLVALSGYPFGNISGDGYEVMLSIRSLRTGTPSALDNDIFIPIVANRANLSFEILMEQQFIVAQNVAIVGTIMKF